MRSSFGRERGTHRRDVGDVLPLREEREGVVMVELEANELVVGVE